MDEKDPPSSHIGDTTDQFNEYGDQSGGGVGTGSGSGSGSDDVAVGGDTTGSGSSSIEKKDRVAIDDELVDLHHAMKAMISSMHAAGQTRKRVDEYSVKYNLPEIGCSKKETDDELNKRLENLKSEHYRTEDCINSSLGMKAADAAEGHEMMESNDDVSITGSDDHFVGATSPESGADLEHDVSADNDTEGSMGGRRDEED